MPSRPVRPPYLLATFTVFWCAAVILFASDAGYPMGALLLPAYGGAVLTIWWAVRAVLDLIRFRRGATLATSRARYLRSWLALPLVLLLALVAARTELLLSFRVLLSSHALAAAVTDVRSSQGVGSEWRPRWVGLFRVSEAEGLPGGARFITTACGFDDCGVIFWKAGTPTRLGEDYYSHLYGPWWRWHRSW
jgi:hypothetical protein